MSIWTTNFQVTIGGHDLSSEIVSMHGKTSLCNPTGQIDIEVKPNLSEDIDPYESVVIYIDGTKVFTGFTQTVTKSRMPHNQTITCSDPMIKVNDTYFTTVYTSHGENISYWIKKFLDLSGVGYQVSDGGAPTPPDKTWAYTSARDAIVDLLRLENWQIKVDPDGVINVQAFPLDTSNPRFTLDELLSFERHKSDSYWRNRAVVIGRNEESSVVQDQSIPQLGDEIRAAVVASPDIIWRGTAHTMAALILNEFSRPLDIITVEIEGEPTIHVGDSARVVESWSDTDETYLVTAVDWRIDASGYVTTVTLNERCPSFWLADREPEILYCATEGYGVWKTYNDGVSWFDISGEDLNSGQPSYAKDIHVIKGESLVGTDDTVWAATLGGIFKTETGADPWTHITEEYMDSQAQAMDWWGVQTEPLEANKVWCVGNYYNNTQRRNEIWMYKSQNGGETWSKYWVNKDTA